MAQIRPGTHAGEVRFSEGQPRPCTLEITQDGGLLSWSLRTQVTPDEHNQGMLAGSDPLPVQIHCDGTTWTGQALMTNAVFTSGSERIGTDFPMAADLLGTGPLTEKG